MKGKFGVIGSMDGWKKGDLPNNHMVNIVLNEYSTAQDGSIALTAQLATDDEVDFAVDNLIEDLNAARIKAKGKLHKVNQKIRGL